MTERQLFHAVDQEVHETADVVEVVLTVDDHAPAGEYDIPLLAPVRAEAGQSFRHRVRWLKDG